MDSHHCHAVTTSRHEKALWIVLGLTIVSLLAEVIGGVLTNSLALLSDAAHMFTDVAAIVFALIGIHINGLTQIHMPSLTMPRCAGGEVAPRSGDVFIDDRRCLLGERGRRDLGNPVIGRRGITVEARVVVQAIRGGADDLGDIFSITMRVARQRHRPLALVVRSIRPGR